MNRPLRYLWAYSAADAWTDRWHQQLLQRRRARGHDVVHLCVTPTSLHRRWLPFPDLDRRWRLGDPALMDIYAAIARAMADRDVLVLYNGANLHPEFVTMLGGWKVYTAGDDPEHSEILSRPVTPAFDQHLVNNIAELDRYRSWGLRHVSFWPLGSQVFPEELAEVAGEELLDRARRDIPVVFVGERNPWKNDRLDRFARAIPGTVCAGSGWPGGRVGVDRMRDLYRRARLGFNLHNSTGPINFRLYDLAAWGVAQVCDNGTHLRSIFTDEEVAGFEHPDDGIRMLCELHADIGRQRRMAAAAHDRWRRDYTPDAIWDRLVAEVSPIATIAPAAEPERVIAHLEERSRRAVFTRSLWVGCDLAARAPRFAMRAGRRALHLLRRNR